MLRLLSIRNFAVVESLEAEFGPGFTVLTGETGAGKSILLDALSLLMGDRFDTRQLRAGAERAEIAAEFAVDEASGIGAWLAEQDLAVEGGLLLRRVLDPQGRSRAWINGRPATLAQLTDAGERLIDLHGQHAHQSLGRAEMQRHLLDAFGGFATLAGEVASAWHAWQGAQERHARAARDAAVKETEREALARRYVDLNALGATPAEWRDLAHSQSRLAHAAALMESADSAEAELVDGEAALVSRLGSLTHKLRQAAAHDSALEEIVALIDEAKIRLDEARRALRDYRDRLDLDPGELQRVERRLAAIHEMARKYRVRPEQLAELASDTEAALTAIAADTDTAALLRAERLTKASFDALAGQLSAKRKFAAAELGHRVSSMMAKLAMAGGRVEVALIPLAEAASHGLERVEFNAATHPKQAPGPLSLIASGGELSRVGLAIQVALSEVGAVPTLIFDEVDAGIGGAVAASVGQLLKQLGATRQVICVTHLPQVAACADTHFLVTKKTRADSVNSALARLGPAQRVEELARMLGGREVTAKTRAHAKEMLLQNQPARRAG